MGTLLILAALALSSACIVAALLVIALVHARSKERAWTRALDLLKTATQRGEHA